ncbi:MAG: aldo/keto reductase [Planctomycetales bacterium]|nr:aldo/keto reductase [Planctomycetales bacterium]
MKYRYLGNSGLLVSRICLGTMTFGMKDWGCDGEEAKQITRRFIEAGGNFIDTADMYSTGVSEEMTGAALKDFNRDDIVLATKCWFRMRPTPNAKGLSRKHILESVDDSLRRLSTDYIDLFQVHGPDPFTPIEETLRALDDVVSSGKVRYLGCSNYYAWQIARSNGIADRLGYARFISGQHMYNLLRREIEVEILPACEAEGMGMLCWSPLGGGMLTGKYKQADGPAAGSRVAVRAEIDLPRYWNDDSFKIIDELIATAERCDKTPAQVALAWLLHDQRIGAVIVGARTTEQLESSLVAGDWDLASDDRQRLSDVVPFARGYPDEWIKLTWGNITANLG